MDCFEVPLAIALDRQCQCVSDRRLTLMGHNRTQKKRLLELEKFLRETESESRDPCFALAIQGDRQWHRQVVHRCGFDTVEVFLDSVISFARMDHSLMKNFTNCGILRIYRLPF